MTMPMHSSVNSCSGSSAGGVNGSMGTNGGGGGGGSGGGNMGGWSAQLGVHKITSCYPGLTVTIDAHRRSPPVKRTAGKIVHNPNCDISEEDIRYVLSHRTANGSDGRGGLHRTNSESGNSTSSRGSRESERSSSSSRHRGRNEFMVLAPGRYVEVLETQVHGGRVRGRIVWEEVLDPPSSKELPPKIMEPHHSSSDKHSHGRDKPKKTGSSRKFDKVHTLDDVFGPPPKDSKDSRDTKDSHSKFRFGRRKSIGGILTKSRGKSPTPSSDDTEQSEGSGHKTSKKPEKITIQYSGWISLMWADDKSAIGLGCDGHSSSPPLPNLPMLPSSQPMAGPNSTEIVLHHAGGGSTSLSSSLRSSPSRSSSSSRGPPNMDEDEGPWTEAVPLGVHKIHISAGLPLRKTFDRDSPVLDIIEKGRYIEVIETQVKGDRVRARCIVPPPPLTARDALAPQLGGGNSVNQSPSNEFKSGWISLVNAASGSSGASPVPFGAYVAVADCGCAVTEGCRLDSRIREVLPRGTCIEVVATRIEEGVVRGLLASGGYISLFAPGDGSSGSAGDKHGSRRHSKSSKNGNPRPDGGLTFAMPVPLGQYTVIYPHGLPVTAGYSRHTPIKTKLKLDDCVEVVETRVESGKVRGRLSAIICSAGISRGWISIFDPSCRWAKYVGRDNNSKMMMLTNGAPPPSSSCGRGNELRGSLRSQPRSGNELRSSLRSQPKSAKLNF